jgi:hypothetical protein
LSTSHCGSHYSSFYGSHCGSHRLMQMAAQSRLPPVIGTGVAALTSICRCGAFPNLPQSPWARDPIRCVSLAVALLIFAFWFGPPGRLIGRPDIREDQ